MSMNIYKTLPKKLARPLLLVLLMSGGSAFLAQQAFSEETGGIEYPPGQIQKWKEYLKNYPQMLTDYYKKQKERRETAKKIVFSKDMSMEEVMASYPFLQ